MDTEGIYLNTIKSIYDKPKVNTTLNRENLEGISLNSGTRQRCSLSQLPFKIVLEVLAIAIRQKREIKAIHIGREVNMSLYADDMILYTENLKSPPRNY